MENDKYFMPGDLVQVRQDIPNKPTMMVLKKEIYIFKNDKEPSLKGIKCRWFTTNGQLQEAIFNTKDLIKLKANE